MKKIRIGLIGCGGRMKRHMDALEVMEDVAVVAVADLVEERRIAAAERFSCKNIFKDHTELYDNMTKDTMDAVIISIEPCAHTDTVTRAIDKGFHFMVEKPMTLDLAQAEKIARDAAAKGLVTSVGFQDRYMDLVDKIREELPKHKKGGLVHGSWTGGIPNVWWWQKKRDCGGQLVEQNIHLLDLLRYFYGEPLSVYATASRGIIVPGKDAPAEYETDDHSTAVIRFENNVTATLTSGCYLKKGNPAAKGLYIVLDDTVIDYRLRNNLTISTATETHDFKRAADQTFALNRVFADAVRTGDKSLIRSDYADALKTLKLGFAANRSMESGQVVYFEGGKI